METRSLFNSHRVMNMFPSSIPHPGQKSGAEAEFCQQRKVQSHDLSGRYRRIILQFLYDFLTSERAEV